MMVSYIQKILDIVQFFLDMFKKTHQLQNCFINFKLLGLGTAKTNFVVGDVLPIKMRNGVFIPLNDTCISNGTDYNCGQDIPRMGMKGVPKGDVIVTLPGNVLFPDIKWLSLYCRNFRISFGDIMLNNTPGNNTDSGSPVQTFFFSNYSL